VPADSLRRRPSPRGRWQLFRIACLAVLAIQILAGAAIAQRTPDQPTLAPIYNENVPNRIPGQYIVVFKPGTSREVVAAAQARVKSLGGIIGYTYTAALIGFNVKLPVEGLQAERALQALRELPSVAYLEVDQIGNLNTIWNQPPTPSTAPPAGVDRTNQRLLPLDSIYSYDGQGNGVHVYVIDTGIRPTHMEFGGRVSGGTNTMLAAAGTDDCHGHGTHVAGTVGGATFGIAKQVFLHPVRAGDCINTYLAPVIAAVDWVTANRVLPAVVNLSSGFSPSPTLETAVTNSVAAPSNVTYVVAAGNANSDACNTSPALVPTAITVGAIDPNNDTRAAFSNFGSCVDLFAPGVNTLSAGIANDTATATMSGTSMATPHVAGVAARYLASFPASTPAQVWAQIDLRADLFGTTASWPGVINPGAGSPNKLLHWGAVEDSFDDGDPHITTVRGVHYDFQSAGEFVILRDANGMQIQARQTPVTTQPPIANSYTGLAMCVSINTAVAARVGTHRVTYQPNLSGQPDPSGMQLRVDGALTALAALPINLGPGARVTKAPTGTGIAIDFPDGTRLIAISNFWGAPHNKWYLNLSVFQTPATEGIMGVLSPGSWLPALPNGTSLGPKPAALSDRYTDLYQKFANAWRVTNATSLFDYAPGTSTATFSLPGWPPEKPPCVVPESPPAKPLDLQSAQKACREVTGKDRNSDCVFDVGITGEPGFAKLYLLSERIQAGTTTTTVSSHKGNTRFGDKVTFTATVARMTSSGRRATPTGSIQFTVDGADVGRPIKLNSSGRAAWTTPLLGIGRHQVSARYIPAQNSAFLASSSFEVTHSVVRKDGRDDTP
jgi:subtilisin family serine protease